MNKKIILGALGVLALAASVSSAPVVATAAGPTMACSSSTVVGYARPTSTCTTTPRANDRRTATPVVLVERPSVSAP